MVDKVEAEFTNVEEGQGWNGFFQTIRAEMNNLPLEITEAKKPQNRKLNRYQDVNPFDHSRIILKNESTDYINASLVSVEKADRKYILAQGPLPHTTSHFWLMIWQQDSRAIIMLNRVIEKNQIKCHQYWPLPHEDSYVFNDVGFKVTFVSEEKFSYYTVTKLKLENLASQNVREVIHFHYTTWPDFGCPESPTAFLKFLAIVRASGVLDNSLQPPVVHCSAGIGRSGTFCLVDSCLRLIKEVNLDNVVVRDVLISMRHYRMGLVQTADQLKFSYLAILEGLKTDINTNSVLEPCERIEEEEEAPPVPPRVGSLAPPSEQEPSNESKVIRERKKIQLTQKISDVKDKMKESENPKSSFPSVGLAAAGLLVCGYVLYLIYRG